MHARGISHRDIKPDNLLVEKAPNGKVQKIMVIDLGTARRFAEGQGKKKGASVAGTDWYMAPEVLTYDYDFEKVDVFSAGRTILVTALGYYPDGEIRGAWQKVFYIPQDKNSPLVQVASLMTEKADQRCSLPVALSNLAGACPAKCVDKFSAIQREELMVATRSILRLDSMEWVEEFLCMDNKRASESVSKNCVIDAQRKLHDAQRSLEVAQQALEVALDGEEAPAVAAAVSGSFGLD